MAGTTWRGAARASRCGGPAPGSCASRPRTPGVLRGWTTGYGSWRAPAIEAHFAKSLVGLSDIGVEFHDTVRSGDDWYLRWTMSTTFASLRDGATVVTSGMSHIRFDSQGRVVLHRDFWDSASGVYEHIPVLGGAIRSVKRRLAGD